MSNKNVYVDWSKAPEGTTQVIDSNLKPDGTPYTGDSWEKVEDGKVYEWVCGRWRFHIHEDCLCAPRLKRPVDAQHPEKSASPITIYRQDGTILASYTPSEGFELEVATQGDATVVRVVAV